MNMAEVSKEALLPSEHGTEGSPLMNEKKIDGVRRSHDEANMELACPAMSLIKLNLVVVGFKRSWMVQLKIPPVMCLALGSGRELDRIPNIVTMVELLCHLSKQRRTMLKLNERVIKTQHQLVSQVVNMVSRDPKGLIYPRKNTFMSEHEEGGQQTARVLLQGGRLKYETNVLNIFYHYFDFYCWEVELLNDTLYPFSGKGRKIMMKLLSMKLATVNPRLEFNVEGFLAKDIIQPRTGMSSSLAFPPDMTASIPTWTNLRTSSWQLGNASETLRRPMSLQSIALRGGFKEPTSQIPGVWDDELHNVVHMGFSMSAPLNIQDLSSILNIISSKSCNGYFSISSPPENPSYWDKRTKFWHGLMKIGIRVFLSRVYPCLDCHHLHHPRSFSL